MVKKLCNYVDGKFIVQNGPKKDLIIKLNPHNNKPTSKFYETKDSDIAKIIDIAKSAQQKWSSKTAINRADFLLNVVKSLEDNKELLIKISAKETGKSYKDSSGEVDAAIRQGYYWASEGYRFFSNVMSSQTPEKTVYSVRDPIGVALLIIPANTAVANIAWKIFPALLCGNSVILKSSEDAPETAEFFTRIIHKSKIPKGVFNLVHGGRNTGKSLVEAPIDLVSFTGSTAAGIKIAEACSKSLKRFSLELGGSNALIVMDDADMHNAINWTLLSSFSNAGQRCAASSHIFVHESVYESFLKELVAKTENLSLGIGNDDDLGPLITKKQLLQSLKILKEIKRSGAIIETGGTSPKNKVLIKGNYIYPSIITNLPENSNYLNEENFAPITALYKFKEIDNVIKKINNSRYGLTGAIHTQNISSALRAANKIKVGVFNINGGTHGSEPHMPFGGTKYSGNGTREPGLEALNVYSELKNITIKY